MAGVLLASCGREHKSQEAATSAQRAATADSLVHTLPPSVAAVPTDSVAVGVVNAPNAFHGTLEKLPVPRIKRGATTLADVPDVDSTAGLGALATDSAQTGELRRFLLTGLPAAQPFTIRPGRDTMLTGAQGTELLVPAGIWELPAADSSAVVTLELQEFYRPADMILAGLSTTAGPQLLETGGMLHIKATANGRPVRLRPGRFLHLRMPAKERQPGMRLFEGVAAGPTHSIDWQVPLPKPDAIDMPLVLQKGKDAVNRRRPRRALSSIHSRRHFLSSHKGPQEPVYDGGEKQLYKDLALYIDYSDALRARLKRGRRMSSSERIALHKASADYEQRIFRGIGVHFDIDTTGAAINPRFPTGTDDGMKKAVIAAVAQLALWEPALIRADKTWHPASSELIVNLYFGEKGPVIAKLLKWDPRVASERWLALVRAKNEPKRRAEFLARTAMQFALQHRGDSLYELRKPYYDSLDAVRQRRALAELDRLRYQFTDSSRTNITEQGVYNELSAQGLGWINCDRFLASSKRITAGVNPGADNAVVTLLFSKIKSVMQGSIVAPTQVLFNNVPQGQKATIVALRREKGTTYLATRPVTLSQLLLGGLVYHPVTMTELRDELARLN